MALAHQPLLILLVLSISFFSFSVNSKYVWPHPSQISQGTGVLIINPSSFLVTTSSNSALLDRAIQRYTSKLFFTMGNGNAPPSGQTLTGLNINVVSGSESLQLGVDESYSLQVNSSSSVAYISAQTVFGALRGLETFSQLIDWSDQSQSYALNCIPTTISDSPRFSWRGLLVDTARHYLDPSTLYRAIDALSYSKFNTLHWHCVDAESFPIESNTYPKLSQNGSYAPTAVYSHDLIKSVITYGWERGIRVVPEFDIPGHAYSWGLGYPDLTVYCPDYASNINNIPLNPTLNSTYQMLTSFIPEMASLFPDNCFHVGGDEVVYGCWTDNQQVSQWMRDNNMNSQQTLQYFEDNLSTILSSTGKNPVVWEDLFDHGIILPNDYIIEVWSEPTSLTDIVRQGYRAITAYGNYLNNQEPIPDDDVGQWVDTWKIFYANDPLTGTNLSPVEQKSVLGGEAAMWGEQVDSTNFDSRVWPRACAVGERLWSPSTIVDVNDAKTRLIEHRCRLARRGIGAGPIAPDYCSIPYIPYSYNL